MIINGTNKYLERYLLGFLQWTWLPVHQRARVLLPPEGNIKIMDTRKIFHPLFFFWTLQKVAPFDCISGALRVQPTF